MRFVVSHAHLGLLLVIGWLVVLLADPLARVYNDLTTPQPWFDVSFSVVDGRVEYRRRINRWMRGEWTATVSLPAPDGWRGICTRSSRYTYRPAASGLRHMTFTYFTGGCTEPIGRYRLCVDYVMTDRRGVVRDFGPFCFIHETEDRRPK